MTDGYDGIDFRTQDEKLADRKKEAEKFASYVHFVFSSLLEHQFTREEAMKIVLECCVFNPE